MGDPVGFYTDMWSVGVLTYILLSGLSPFGGANDDETLVNVKNCDWNMNDSAFDGISEEAKNFIRNLLVMNVDFRLNVHSALDHSWLSSKNAGTSSKQIPSTSFIGLRDAIRNKYVRYYLFIF